MVAVRKILFACVQNAGRSQMAAALFNRLAPEGLEATSAGTRPARHVHPEVVDVMAEVGIDLALAEPRALTPELVASADLVVTMGCGEECPAVPGVQRRDWPLPDPAGRDLDTVRAIRDEIRGRVESLIAELEGQAAAR